MWTAYRNKPEIGKTNSMSSHTKIDDDPMSCVWLPLGIVISYFVLSAIIRVISNSGSKLDRIICYGTLICFVGIMLLGARDAYQEGKAKEAERKKWANGCKTALLTIARRHEASSWWDDYSFRYHNAPNYLEVEMNSDQKAVSPNHTIIRAEVNQYVYDRLKKSNTVHIYYKPESPMTFLLEEEL